MKKSSSIALGVCLAGALAIGIGLRAAAAQMADIVTVKLPYAASVGKVTLPAGEYTIRDLKDDGSTAVLSIRSAAGPGVSALVTQVSSPNNKPAGQTEVVLARWRQIPDRQNLAAGTRLRIRFAPRPFPRALTPIGASSPFQIPPSPR